MIRIFKPFLTSFVACVLFVNANADEPSPLNAQSALLPQYENRIGFNFPLIGLSYERSKPNSYYIGIDGQIFFPTFKADKVINFEARVGYLQIKGLFSNLFYKSYEGEPEFAYASLGFRYEYEQMKGLPCSAGINAQGLLAYRLPTEWNRSSQNYEKITGAFPVFGFKGSIPVIFRFV